VRRSEYVSAALFAAFGLIVAVASWRLDRLSNLNINPWSAPGLLPGVVGVLMIVLAGALALQASRSSAPAVAEPGIVESAVAEPALAEPAIAEPAIAEPAVAGGWRRTLLAMAMCVLFAGVSLGHGLPFIVEGAVFILAFIVAFSWAEWRAQRRVARGFATSLLIAVVSSAAISWLFESVFLVRLP
jgi:hypothetical protein